MLKRILRKKLTDEELKEIEESSTMFSHIMLFYFSFCAELAFYEKKVYSLFGAVENFYYENFRNNVFQMIEKTLLNNLSKKVNPMEARIPKFYTYADYLELPEDARVELIDGVIYDMSPAPPRVHQKIVSELTITIGSYLRQNKKPCEIYTAPFDVVLIEEAQDEKQAINVVQPDISIICDKRKLTDKGCVGAPEMIIEVASEYNPSHDYVRKLNLYNQFKVKEYWIVNPYEESILVYKYKDNIGYSSPKVYTFHDKVKVGIFEDLIIDFAQIKEVL